MTTVRGVRSLCLALGLLTAVGAPASSGVLEPYPDPAQQLALRFGERSYWHQPWRAYVDTQPASRLLEGIGINLNVPPEQADAVCRHLAANGFRRVRVEVGWGSFRYDEPSLLANPEAFATTVGACMRYGLRPLFLLNGHHGYPCPIRPARLRLREPAEAGATEITLEDTADVVPGYTGLNGFGDYWAARVLLTEVDAATGCAQLSRPLPTALPAGDVEASTLRYRPFAPLTLADGSPTPGAEETLAGWVTYVRGLTAAAKRALGTEGANDAGFDLEVWNELTFGSNFLHVKNYYDPPLLGDRDWVIGEILRRTVEYVSDPANGLPGVRVGDGFNNQWPWGAGSTAPVGLGALDKHPYAGSRHYPEADDGQGAYGLQPLDALGAPDGTVADRTYLRPEFGCYFPEYALCALQTEHITRDVSPLTTDIYGVKHGRFTHPAGGAPVEMWITETGIAPNERDPQVPADVARHIKGKTTLRYLTCFLNKGMGFVTLFAAAGGDGWLGLVSDAFLDAVKAGGGAYPDDDGPLTSPAMSATRNLVRAFEGAEPLRYTRALELARVEEPEERFAFVGDGTPRHPSLPNRELLAFLPFQISAGRYVVAYYVMTRDVMQVWRPELPASDPTRLDMPEETFILTLRNVRGTSGRVSAYDPLRDREVPVEVLARSESEMRVQVLASDSPYLLSIEEDRSGPLIASPRIERDGEAGSWVLRFSTNVPCRCRVTIGEGPAREGLAMLEVDAAGGECAVPLPEFGTGGTLSLRLQAEAEGLTANWPVWDEDVAASFNDDGTD